MVIANAAKPRRPKKLVKGSAATKRWCAYMRSKRRARKAKSPVRKRRTTGRKPGSPRKTSPKTPKRKPRKTSPKTPKRRSRTVRQLVKEQEALERRMKRIGATPERVKRALELAEKAARK